MKIFLFHRVHPAKDLLWDPINPKIFDEQLAYLSKKYEIVALEDYLDGSIKVSGKKELAAIVFDDGYRDFLEYAFPILQKYKLPSSLYVVTAGIDEQKLIWTYQLDYLFINSHKLILELEGQQYNWETNEERIAFGKILKPKLKKYTYTQRQEVLEAIHYQLNDVVLPQNMYLNWHELRGLQQENVYISSHTVTHPMLASIEDEKLIEYELTHSAHRIKEELGYFPKTISYPIGSFDNRVTDIAKQVGYTYGLAVEQRAYKEEQDSLFAIPRIELYNESLWKSKLRATEVIQTIKKWKSKIL